MIVKLVGEAPGRVSNFRALSIEHAAGLAEALILDSSNNAIQVSGKLSLPSSIEIERVQVVLRVRCSGAPRE